MRKQSNADCKGELLCDLRMRRSFLLNPEVKSVLCSVLRREF